MTNLLTGIWREDIPAYERKIDKIIENISENTEIKENTINEIIELIKGNEQQNIISDYIINSWWIDIEQIEKQFEVRTKDCFIPETQKMKWILEKNISEIKNFLWWITADKKSSKLIKELAIQIILLNMYNKKFEKEKIIKKNIKYRIMKTIKDIELVLKWKKHKLRETKE